MTPARHYQQQSLQPKQPATQKTPKQKFRKKPMANDIRDQPKNDSPLLALRRKIMESINAADIQTLKALIKESLREVLREERMNLCQLLMPFVSDDEQAKIEASLGSPDDYNEDEFIDLTNWVRHGGLI
jgi:hypothetical protein